jgi:tetratricopeptide (TPR) repeat protein
MNAASRLGRSNQLFELDAQRREFDVRSNSSVNRKTFKLLLLVIGTSIAVGLTSASSRAQDPPDSSSAPPPASKAPSDPFKDPTVKPTKKTKDKDSATTSAADQPKYDPLRAEKDLEVGKYYMNKGDIDAAIDRFQDAADSKPGYAIPYKFLGEAQEKKKQKRAALQSYKRYLELYPHAEDKDKIQKKIDKLYNEAGSKGKPAS